MHPTADLSLPRDRWTEHPRYPEQILLLGSHRQFRHLSRVLTQRAADGGDATAIQWLFRQWKHMMTHGHEAYEERKLYPFLHARWGIDCTPLQDGHAALHACDEAVRGAFADGPASTALAEALREHDRVLNAHLDLEEAVVIPALLALSPEEFERYTRSDIRTLLDGLQPR